MPLTLGKPQPVAFAILVGATTVAPTSRAMPADAAVSSPLPPPKRTSVNTTVFLPALGYVRSSTFGVSLDLFDVELAVGYGYQHGEFGLDLGGGFAGVLGRTEAGRAMRGLLMEPLILVFHYDWFRFGLGAGIGPLSATRATNGVAESGGSGEVWGAIGAEPLGPSGRPVFIEARAGLMAWGEPAPMFSLAIGMRGCLIACR